MNPTERSANAQRLAADPGAHVFVTANAGSGKTKVLIDRIARLLLAGAEPSEILCITYTKAAAAEMQRRLFQQLGDWAVMADEPLAQALGALLGETPFTDRPGLFARARALFARALETPGGLNLQTIHAFCERLIARFPIEAGVAPGFSIAEEAQSQRLRAKAIERALAAPGAHAAAQRFAERLPKDGFDQLIADLSLRGAAFAGFDPAAMASLRGDPRPIDVVQAAIIDGAPWELIARAEAALRDVGGVKNGQLAEALAQAQSQRTPENLRAAFFKSDGDPYQDRPTKPARAAHPCLDALFSDDGERGRLAALEAEARASERLADALAIAALGEAVAGAYAAEKRAAGLLDFDDLIAHARALLSDAEAAAWVLYRLDGGLAHVLVDEGQDTSPAQWALIAPLTAEFFAGEGAREDRRTVFAVGDPKQSIYSFQGADPAGFLREGQALSRKAHDAAAPFIAPDLTTSFRSCPEILAAVDATFADGGLLSTPPQALDRIVHHAAREAEAGLVEWWPVAPRPDRTAPEPWDAPFDSTPSDSAQRRLATAIAERLTQWIGAGEAVWEKGRQRAMTAGDVLILVRKRGPLFHEILKALKQAGLPVAGADRMRLCDELAVQDVLTIARAGLDPDDDLSVACALTGPFAGLDDQALFDLAHPRDGSLFAAAQASAEPRVQACVARIERARDRAGGGPFALIADLLEAPDAEGISGWRRIIDRLGPQAQDPLEELLARALSASRAGLEGVAGFIAAIEADAAEIKREMEAPNGAVRVMTVHGAKGLEAAVTILPDTTDGPGLRAGPQLYLGPEGPIWTPSQRDDDAPAAEARRQAEFEALSEHRRLLYVAMTRARDRLIVCGHGRGQGAGSAKQGSWHEQVGLALSRIGAPCETPFGPGYRLGEGRRVSPGDPATPDPAAEPPAWLRTREPTPPTTTLARPSRADAPRTWEDRIAGRSANRRGIIVHALLHRLADCPPIERAARGAALTQAMGASAAECQAWTAEALAVLEAPAFAELFGAQSRGEVGVAGEIEGAFVSGVVDRVAVGAAGVWIVDFKSDRAIPETLADIDPAYVRQLSFYAHLLAPAFPGRPLIRALLYTRAPKLLRLDEPPLR